MSIENNKRDFEAALVQMVECVEVLEQCIDSDIVDVLKDVIKEYDMHLKSDIETMMDANEEMKDQLEES
jgi:hypothetical protein